MPDRANTPAEDAAIAAYVAAGRVTRCAPDESAFDEIAMALRPAGPAGKSGQVFRAKLRLRHALARAEARHRRMRS